MLTEQQIRDMELGRELDDEIRLMLGWTKFREKEDGTFACWVTPEGKQWTYPSSGSLPRYSTDISAAWELIRKMEEYDFEILKAGEHCEVSVGSMTALVGDNVPELICKAALIAILRGGSGE